MSSRWIQRPGPPGPAFNGSGPGGQESALEIIQGTDTVLGRGESLVSQVIYMDARPRPPADVHLQLGSARGHWEGDTLIVEYTNFSGADGGRRHLTARYKLLDANHLHFRYISDDHGGRTKPFSAQLAMW